MSRTHVTCDSRRHGCRRGRAGLRRIGRSARARPDAGRLPLQERRRADQRQRHGHGSRPGVSCRVSGRRTSSCTRTTSRWRSRTISAERVPVSLGIVLDTSGSMAGDKWDSALDAIDRSSQALPDPQDEFFMYRFSADPELVHDWTDNRNAVSRALVPRAPQRRHGDVRRRGRSGADGAGGPQSQEGDRVDLGRQRHQQPPARVRTCRQMVRETEVLVYAVGIDGQAESTIFSGRPQPPVMRPPAPTPFPVPGRRRRHPVARFRRPGGSGGGSGVGTRRPPTIASTSSRCARSPTTAAAEPKSCATRAISIRPPPASPTS